MLRPVDFFAAEPLRLDVLRAVPERDGVERDRDVPDVERARDVPELEPDREVPDVDREREEVPLFAVPERELVERDREVPVERAREVPDDEPLRDRDVLPDDEPLRERDVPDEPLRDRVVPDDERGVDFVPLDAVFLRVVEPLRLVPVRDELRDVPEVERERLVVEPEPDRERLPELDLRGVAARARETPSSVVGSPPDIPSSNRSGAAPSPP